MEHTFNMPENLSNSGQMAWAAIITLLMTDDPSMSSGGCQVFRSPEEHKSRYKEAYGLSSELIVVYDGGDHRPYFNYCDSYETIQRVKNVLDPLDMFFEECTGWYGAIYRL